VNPLALVLLFPLALVGLARAFGIYPRAALVWLALVPAVASVGLLAGREFLPLLWALDALIVLVMLADLFTLPRREMLAVEREMQRVASLKTPHPVTLTVSNRAKRAIDVWVRDDVPDECETDREQFLVKLAPLSRSSLTYHISALRRGAFRLQLVYVRVASRLGLWKRDFRYAAESDLHVYPDMRQMREYSLLARTDRLNLVGLRRTRRIGQDNEFERLRDYTLDDNYKHIDWRSTARRGKLTVKDFQANQSQRVLFLVDCGRMMTNTVGGISLLDHAFNAALLLSYVALNKGDSVGLLCFSDEVQAFVPPRGGMTQMNRLLHASFDRFPRLVESRYDEAFVYLNARCRKRSLVILITNIIDEVNSNQVGRYLTSLVGRHLPLGVLLRDHAIFDAANVPAMAGVAATDDATLYRATAAQDIITWRTSVLRDLESQGVLALDVFPEQMTAPLVNRYLEIKARHLL
jgi:uncharacterized protein (DUF58 family)